MRVPDLADPWRRPAWLVVAIAAQAIMSALFYLIAIIAMLTC